MSKTKTHRKSERGNVLFYILIAVALLAALSYAVANSSRGNLNQITEEKARLFATEIIEYANIMTNAVAQLRLRGVGANELCFDHDSWPNNDYNHAGCADDTHKIFHPAGAGLIWTQPPEGAMGASPVPDNLWHIYGDNAVDNVGTTCATADCADLILVVDELNEQTCIQLNELLGVTSEGDPMPTDTNIGETLYDGAFTYSAIIGDEAGGTDIQGKPAGCFQRTAAPAEYTFYKVLQAR